MLPLKTTLLVNAVSSGATGAGLIIFKEPVAEIFGVTNIYPFVGTGIFLLAFAVFVFITATKKHLSTAQINLVSAMDILWVVSSVMVLIMLSSLISVIGIVAIIAVAGWVGMMAYLQLNGIRKLSNSSSLANA